MERIDEENLLLIQKTDYNVLLNGKDNNGIPFLKHIFILHKKLFGTTCSSCPSQISGYIQKLKTFNNNTMKKEEKKESKFQLNAGALIVFGGTSRSYSEHNLTDEVAIEFLAQNTNRKAMFSKLPNNLEKLIQSHNEAIELQKQKDFEIYNTKVFNNEENLENETKSLEGKINDLEVVNSEIVIQSDEPQQFPENNFQPEPLETLNEVIPEVKEHFFEEEIITSKGKSKSAKKE